MKISFTIIAKNADKQIENTLVNISGIASEIIVVDNGSTDATKTIAQKYTHKVFSYPHIHDFGKLKEIARSKASGDWIFNIDTDELLSDSLKHFLQSLRPSRKVDGIWFSRRLYLSVNVYLKYGLFYPDYQLRFFRNRKNYQYTNGVHTVIAIPATKTKYMRHDILHFQSPSKYGSWKGFYYLLPYIQMDSSRLSKEKIPSTMLLWKAIERFVSMFFGGMFRGKGLLDGYAGFRAHFLFASSISLSYLLAAYKRMKH